uniref:Uncharacterized protein n=1 Tax=Arundo donax TaxID=35708 RepID=A0A0A9F3G2_ARUDO
MVDSTGRMARSAAPRSTAASASANARQGTVSHPGSAVLAANSLYAPGAP